MASSDFSKEIIKHDGVVQETGDKSVFVKITSVHACSGCHAEGSCSMTGKEEKLVEVTGKYDLNTGDAVTVLMQRSMGYSAVFLGYVLPLIFVIIALVILVSFSVPELTAGLLSFSVLAIYYLLMYVFRSRIDKKFMFTIKF